MIHEFVFGGAGILVSLAMLFYTLKALWNFEHTSEVTIAINVPHVKVHRALWLLLVGFAVLVFSMVAGSAGLVYENELLDTVSKLAGGFVLLTLLYFVRSVALATSPE